MPANPIYTLSPLEKKIFNDLSQRIDRTVFLGNKLQEILTLIEKSATKVDAPVNVILDTESLSLSADSVAKKKKTPFNA